MMISEKGPFLIILMPAIKNYRFWVGEYVGKPVGSLRMGFFLLPGNAFAWQQKL